MIICHWAKLHYNMSFQTIARKSDGVFWWFPALSEDQENFCRIHQNYLVALKPMYRFGKWWKWKIFLMGVVYRVVRVLKALWIYLTFSGCPRKFYHRVMYIAPSSGHISLNFNVPFKLILRRFELVFWCLEWECCTFFKDWWKLIQIHQYYTMALTEFTSVSWF